MSTALVNLTNKLASQFDLGDGTGLTETLKSTAFKSDKPVSDEQMTALLIVANQYGLNPFTREIYAFPDKGGIVPVVGVDGWSRIMNSDTRFDGIEFRQDNESCTCIIHRKDRNHPTMATEYMDECKRDNSTAWKSHPRRMLRHKAMIQAARLAFGFTGIYDQDEAERIIEIKNKEIDITPHSEHVEAKLLSVYPDDKFNKNMNVWEASVNSGKHTPENIINMISTKHVLTEEQKKIIRSFGDNDANA
ncbi:phage recombination protein Bet [Nitrosomonas sp. PY1]|uniref:phage recombination protein Bet n=1 Tax=Nitrosomonas sp. PY1 TaxID=1803906 RepID=UPI002086B0AB|nr:phage recombination protein Bet [Nitrosomonas sp. PY1]GKS68958.1 phage recombination protein Bet [Nitrosomonas sp. PY1]